MLWSKGLDSLVLHCCEAFCFSAFSLLLPLFSPVQTTTLSEFSQSCSTCRQIPEAAVELRDREALTSVSNSSELQSPSERPSAAESCCKEFEKRWLGVYLMIYWSLGGCPLLSSPWSCHPSSPARWADRVLIKLRPTENVSSWTEARLSDQTPLTICLVVPIFIMIE